MKLLGIGRTAEVYEIDENKVLKLFYDYMPYELVQKEYEISLLLSQKIMNMPKVFKLTTNDNRHGIVYQRIAGIHMGSFMQQKPNKISEVIKEFSLLHKEINETFINNTELEIDNTNDIVLRIQKSTLLSEDDKEVIKQYLLATDQKQLCHGDFHPENVLIDSNMKLWAIDWLTIVVCNKMYDAARTYYLLRYGQSPEKKTLFIKLLEKNVCLYLSNVYYRICITTLPEKELFRCYFFIIVILRFNDGIHEESKKLHKLIKHTKKRALKMMNTYLKNNSI